MSEKAKRYYWLKLPENWFRQKNVKRLRSIAGGDTYTIIYLKMMLRSLQSDGKLYFDGYENNFSDEIALDIDEDPNNVRVAVNFLINAGLLVLDNQMDAQAATLPECLKLTGSESSSAQRVRKFRARESAKSVTCNGDVTNCNTEIEIEKELEIDTKRESKERKSRSHFVPPTVEEVYDYCEERHNGIDPMRFVDYYSARGWKNITDWKAQVRVWESKVGIPASEF